MYLTINEVDPVFYRHLITHLFFFILPFAFYFGINKNFFRNLNIVMGLGHAHRSFPASPRMTEASLRLWSLY